MYRSTAQIPPVHVFSKMGIYYGRQSSDESGATPHSGTSSPSHSIVTPVCESSPEVTQPSDSSNSGISSGLLVTGFLPPTPIPPTTTPEPTGVHYFSHEPPLCQSRPCTGIISTPDLKDACIKQISQDQGYGTNDFGKPINSGLIQQLDADCEERPTDITNELAPKELLEYGDRPNTITDELAPREQLECGDRPNTITDELAPREQLEYEDRPITITEELALENRENSVPKDATLLPQQFHSNYQNYSFPSSQSFLFSTTECADVSKYDISSPNSTLLDTGQYDLRLSPPAIAEREEENLQCFPPPEYESHHRPTSSSLVISIQSPVMPLGNTGFCVGGVVFGPPDDRDPLYRRPDCRRHYNLWPP